ncbi:HET-domain-containing protein [Paramyrothecium foliicola]|nr:HET-domain-containing protein [Paramyrothecium foliicola]
MRLINVETGAFEEFIGRNIPEYAILSHTWGQEEVSFKMMTSEPCYAKLGYQKIAMTCSLASKVALRYAWIDTCCIDKSSSAELTEAINSMFRWYKRSNVCYVFLSDLEASAPLEPAFGQCRWFTRGWTLQELIAPHDVLFFDQDWNYRGSKQSLVGHISRITGISMAILEGTETLFDVVVAQRMSWAARRETTRVEDMAYCLLGIFNVNMPLLYGEEDKAFRRLQEEIIRSTSDLSIFAWVRPDTMHKPLDTTERVFCGVLAESPACFADCFAMTRAARQEMREVTFTNAGVKLRARIHHYIEMAKGKRSYRYVWRLGCSRDGVANLGVRLRKCGADQFVREDPWSLLNAAGTSSPSIPGETYLLTDFPSYPPNALLSGYSVAQTRESGLQMHSEGRYVLHSTLPRARFDEEDQVFYTNTEYEGDSAIARIGINLDLNGKRYQFVAMFIAVGWSQQVHPGLQCSIVDCKANAAALNEFEAEFPELEHDRDAVTQKLAYFGIPKARSALLKNKGTDCTVMVSYRATLVNDSTVCGDEFWRVEFHHEIYGTDNVPTPECGKWEVTYGRIVI